MITAGDPDDTARLRQTTEGETSEGTTVTTVSKDQDPGSKAQAKTLVEDSSGASTTPPAAASGSRDEIDKNSEKSALLSETSNTDPSLVLTKDIATPSDRQKTTQYPLGKGISGGRNSENFLQRIGTLFTEGRVGLSNESQLRVSKRVL